MRPVTMGLAATCSAIFALGACNEGHAPPTGPQSSSSTATPSVPPSAIQAAPASGLVDGGDLVITGQDDGRTFDAARNATVTFRLETHAGTGFTWAFNGLDTSVLTQQGDRTVELTSDAPGARKVEVYRFIASAPGSTEVEMALKRPFGDAQAARTLHVTIHIH